MRITQDHLGNNNSFPQPMCENLTPPTRNEHLEWGEYDKQTQHWVNQEIGMGMALIPCKENRVWA